MRPMALLLGMPVRGVCHLICAVIAALSSMPGEASRTKGQQRLLLKRCGRLWKACLSTDASIAYLAFVGFTFRDVS